MKPDEALFRRNCWMCAGGVYKTFDALAVAASIGMHDKRALYILRKMREIESGSSDRYVWFRDPPTPSASSASA